MKTDKFYYVPLLESLANILKLEDFQAEILNPHENQSNEQLNDFCDGSLFKSHYMFSSDPNALQIIAYYDELEVVNPIGLYVKKTQAWVVCSTFWQILGPNIAQRLKQYSYLQLESMRILRNMALMNSCDLLLKILRHCTVTA